MTQFLANWGLIGFVCLLIIPKKYFRQPSKLRAWILLFCLGPMGWILFPIACLQMRLENSRVKK